MDPITNITDEPIQRHVLIFDRGEAVVTIRYLPTVEMWKMRVEYNGDYIEGVKLSLGRYIFGTRTGLSMLRYFVLTIPALTHIGLTTSSVVASKCTWSLRKR